MLDAILAPPEARPCKTGSNSRKLCFFLSVIVSLRPSLYLLCNFYFPSPLPTQSVSASPAGWSLLPISLFVYLSLSCSLFTFSISLSSLSLLPVVLPPPPPSKPYTTSTLSLPSPPITSVSHRRPPLHTTVFRPSVSTLLSPPFTPRTPSSLNTLPLLTRRTPSLAGTPRPAVPPHSIEHPSRNTIRPTNPTDYSPSWVRYSFAVPMKYTYI